MSKEVAEGHQYDLDDDLHIYENEQHPVVEEDRVDSQSCASKTPVGSSPSLNENESSYRCNTKSLTSKVWLEMDRVVKDDGEVFAICKHCSFKMKGGSASGTSHLRNHLLRCKKKKNKDIKQLMLQANETRVKGKVEYRNYAFDQEVSRNDLASMIIIHEYPLSMVDHHWFRVYSKNLQPLFQMVSRNTIKSDILKIYNSKKEKVHEMLEGLDSRVSITTDMWTAKPTKKGYMAITAHFIDSSWVMQSKILRFIYVPPPHSSDVLTEFLIEALMDMNVDRMLSTVTVDNATTNDAMLEKIVERLDPSTLIFGGRVLHMRCCAHILNLIVKDGLEVIKKEVEKVRASVVFWIASHSRIQKFEEAARHLFLQHSKNLTLDCPTRWNSTYTMLETALLYKSVFPRLKQKERTYTCLPDEEEWKKVEKITEKLKLFYDVTKMFSGTSYPTSNEFFPKICEIKVSLSSWICSNELYISDMAKKMLEKYNKYWNVCHEILGVACVLDPRYKMKMLEFYLSLIHGEFASFEIARIRDTCYDLMLEYQSKYRVKDNVVGGTTLTHPCNKVNENDPLSNFDKFVSSTSSNMNVKSELDHYLEESVLPRTANFDVLSWWKTNGVKFPTLQRISRDILAILISSVASESAFSTSGRLISPHRSKLAPNTLEALMCSQSWLRNENHGLPLEAGKLRNMATCNDDMDVDD